MPFKLTGQKTVNSSQETFMALLCQMESSQQRQMRLQDISARKAIWDQYGYTTPTRNRNVSQLYAISRNVGVILDARASQTRVRQRNW